MVNPILLKCKLFENIENDKTQSMLKCFELQEKTFSKNQSIYKAGDEVKNIGIVLSGSVSIRNDDFWGNSTLISCIGEGEIFAETYACVPLQKLMIDVTANENTSIAFININRILSPCAECCENHTQVLLNLLLICAEKSINLSKRILHTSSKTIRGRVLSYLSSESVSKGTQKFEIQFNRQQMADYLGIDRSALSAELSKMKNEGIIDFHRNTFRLLEKL